MTIKSCCNEDTQMNDDGKIEKSWSCYYTAKQFHKAAGLLDIDPGMFEIDYYVPHSVVLYFACELYLKSLLINLDIDFKKTHNLYELFRTLSDKRGDIAESIFNGCNSVVHSKVINKCVLGKVLRDEGNNFCKFRYSFDESKPLSAHLNVMIPFISSLEKECDRIFNHVDS